MTARIAGFALVCLALLLAGCNGGAEGYSVSGKVTYAGQPLPGGSIQFEPAGTGEAGRQSATAAIENGVYELPSGQAISGGSYTVRINPPPIESGADLSQAVQFPPYETTVDLPKEHTEKDFDVPAQSAGR